MAVLGLPDDLHVGLGGEDGDVAGATSAWSSQTSTRIGAAALTGSLLNGDACADPEPALGPGSGLQFTIEHPHPFTQPGQASSARLGRFAGAATAGAPSVVTSISTEVRPPVVCASRDQRWAAPPRASSRW